MADPQTRAQKDSNSLSLIMPELQAMRQENIALINSLREENNSQHETIRAAGVERNKAIAVVDERQQQVLARLKVVEEAVNGNGKPGLKADIHELSNQVLAINAQHEEEHRMKSEEEKLLAGEKVETRVGFKKFQWGVWAAFIAVAIDVIRDFILKH